MRKFLCLLLAVLSLVSVVALPLSAAGVTPQQTEIVDFSKTTVEDDLIGSTFTSALGISQKIKNADDIKRLYPKTLIGEPHIISVVESGYDAAQGSASDVDLYVYVYDPTASCVIKSESNSITLANSYDFRPVDGEAETSDATKWEAKSYKTYSLSYIGRSENRAVIKYRVDGFDFKNNVFGGVRRYDISRIDLDMYKAGQGVDLKAYTVGQATICTGSAADGSYKTSTTGFDVLEISDIRQTHFLYNNLSREHYQTEIHSVYFSIPNSYLKKYENDLYYIAYNAVRERTTPIVITCHEDLYNQILEYQGKDLNDYAEKPEFSVGVGTNVSLNAMAQIYEYDWCYNYIKRTGNKTDINATLLYWVLPIKQDDGSWASSIKNPNIKNSALLEIYEEYKKHNYTDHATLMENGLVENYSNATSETGDKYGQYTEKIYAIDPQNSLKGYSYVNGFHKFFAEIVGMGKDELDLSKTDSIQLLRANDIAKLGTLTNDEISKKYLVDDRDVKDFVEFCVAANSKKETVFVMHFASSLYYSRNAVVEGWGSFELEATHELNKAYIVKEDIFLDFTLIEMAFGDAVAYTVVPLVTQPIDVIPPPEDPILSIIDKFGISFEKKGNDLAPYIYAILCIVAFIVVAWLVYKYIVTPIRKINRKRRYQGKNRRSRNRRSYKNRRYKR